MTRAKGRGARVEVDFRCGECVDYDRPVPAARRMGLLWIDVRRPGVVLSRLPGGRSLPDGWRVGPLRCQCGTGFDADRAEIGDWLAGRADLVGPSTFEWRVGGPGEPYLGCSGVPSTPSSRGAFVERPAAGPRSTGQSLPRESPLPFTCLREDTRVMIANIPVRAVESAPTATEPATTDRIAGRVIEARGTDSAGGRIFRVRVIKYGESLNGRHYPEAVLREAMPLYAGAKCYDHHRDEAELRSSTIAGLVGSLRNVEATTEGLEADLHLLPSATRTAEALDASLAAQAAGLPPLVGISHDVLSHFRPITEGGKRTVEATKVVKVNSADVVADPAAGGQAVRMVAGGTEPDDTDTSTTEVQHDRGTARGRAVVAQEAAARNLPASAVEHLTAVLPQQFTEAQLATAIDSMFAMLADTERAGLEPAGTVRVTQEAHDKKTKALDAFFTLDATAEGGGYRTLREAYLDITGHRVRFLDEDLNKRILQDSFGGGFDSAMRGAESMNSTSWAQVLGDSVTRRLIAEYRRPAWQDWRLVVSTVEFGVDFRTQRRARFGGYGLLPTVAEGAPYQPLTSPPDEEATYALTKRGGTEDLTLEMIANDDMSATRRIPLRLGRSAATTLYRFVFDLFPANAATTYDSVALFHASHANTDAAALSNSALTTGRRKMRKQAAYADSTDVLSLTPKWLLVPSDLEESALQLVSAYALPTATNDPSDRRNLHQGLEPIVVDYWTDTNDWYLLADPAQNPTIELGFYARSDVPELFTQADQTSGSMFSSDVLTFKIRHAYSGAVIDHRAFYRGSQ